MRTNTIFGAKPAGLVQVPEEVKVCTSMGCVVECTLPVAS
jgi:hypothetical protein